MAQNPPAQPAIHDLLQQPGTLHALTLILYAAFAIPVTIVALKEFPPAGIGLAVVFAVFWPRLPKSLRRDRNEIIGAVGPTMPERGMRPSGNTSFDAYRAQMLNRLEQEQGAFEGILDRLRAAKDQHEFDDFLEARARAARSETAGSASRIEDRGQAPA